MARKRTLSGDERTLWETVARSAKALTPKPLEIIKPAPEKTPPPAPMPKAAKPPLAARPQAPAQQPAAAKPAPLDRRMRSRLSRGLIPVDARLDLHGLTQSAAHQRLRRFLADAQADGARLVLVITGKGKLDDAPRAEERGVLRRAVPDWLRAGEFGLLVAGFEEAGRRHGGAGALYVRIKRKRG